MNVKIIFRARDTVKFLNTKCAEKKKEIAQSKDQMYADCLFSVAECIENDLLSMLQDDAGSMPLMKEFNLVVADKNKVMLPSIISNDTDNTIRNNTRERAWQIERYWRNGLSSLPSDYASIKEMLRTGYLDGIDNYTDDNLDDFYNVIIDRAFKVIEDVIENTYLVCYGYEE